MNHAHIFICTGPTCSANCDRDGNSKPPIDVEELKKQWKEKGLYGAVHLTFAGCLGRCNTANQALIVSAQAPQYFMKLDGDKSVALLVSWAEEVKAQDRLAELPSELQQALYERMAPK